MTPFRCTSICQAPDEVFLGTPQILQYVNTSEVSIPYKENGTFTLTCALWNGIGLSGVSGDDIKWFKGWEEVDIRDTSRWQRKVQAHEREADKTVFSLGFEPRMTDIGIYECVLPGLKDYSSLSFGTGQAITRGDFEKGGQHELMCLFDVSLADFESRRLETQIKLFFSKEIDKGIHSLSHFTTSTTKFSERFSESTLTFHFSKKGPDLFEGRFTCKRRGTGGFSNSVDIKMKVDATWTTWTTWGSCSKTCLDHTRPDMIPGTQRRTRECQPAKNGGVSCSDLDGDFHEDQSCNLNCCPKNGIMMSWSRFSKCDKDCSREGEEPGRYNRTRTCQPPQCGGRPCEGALIEGGECNSFETKPCPINGNWGEWSHWSDCQAGEDLCHGKNVKTRECNNPAPKYGGAKCSGSNVKEKFCDVKDCPVDCTCNPVNDVWSSCSKVCTPRGESPGEQINERVCTEGANGGKTCKQKYEVELKQQLVRKRTCNTQCCPVHGDLVYKSKCKLIFSFRFFF